MKIVRGILGFMAGVLLLLFLTIFACYVNPNLSSQMSSVIAKVTGTAANTSKNTATAASAGITNSSGNTSNASTNNAGTNNTSMNNTNAQQVNPPANGTYVAPTTSSQQIASNVTGKAGFVPIAGTYSQVKDTQIPSIQNQTNAGKTGEGLTFDTTMYPYYGMLSDNEKKLYSQIYANASAQNQTFSPVTTANETELKDAFTAVSNDHPEIFWLDTSFSAKASLDGSVVEITLQWNEIANQLSQAKQNFSNSANAILSGAKNLGSDYEKEVYVHDKLISQVSYDAQAAVNQSAYSAMVNGKTVCAGYAKAFQYLMQQLNIPCYYCTGFSGENHAWNIIKLDDGYYNIDTTWDDTDPNTHTYFNKTDAEFSKDHKRTDMSVKLPACNGKKYDTAADSNLKSLSDYGLTQADVISNINDYNKNCLTQLTGQTGSDITFSNVVKTETLWNQIYSSYQDNSYQNAYMINTLKQKNATSAQIGVKATPLEGGYYLIEHTVSNIH